MSIAPPSSSSPPESPAATGRGRLGCVAAYLGAAALALTLAEVILRGQWGLGTPVLYEWDGRFEYRMVPGQRVTRFGKHILTNALGLRGPEFGSSKFDPAELRVLVLGDSVVNGGSHVDQSALGTEVLRTLLDRDLARPVTVMNVSANSWGPPNQLAWLEANGALDADIAIVVVSTHDAVDVPLHMAEAVALDGQVYNAPWCALTEVAGMAWSRLAHGADAPAPDEADTVKRAASTAAFRAMLERLKRDVPHVLVACHWDREELAAGAPRAAQSLLVGIAESLAIPVTQLGPAMLAADASPTAVLAALRDDSANIFIPTGPVMHDRIHPTEFGQIALGVELYRTLEKSGWYADVINPDAPGSQ